MPFRIEIGLYTTQIISSIITAVHLVVILWDFSMLFRVQKNQYDDGQTDRQKYGSIHRLSTLDPKHLQFTCTV